MHSNCAVIAWLRTTALVTFNVSGSRHFNSNGKRVDLCNPSAVKACHAASCVCKRGKKKRKFEVFSVID